MNERIKEIVKETVRQTNLSGVYIPDEFVQRFAELIVRECIEISQVGSITEEKIKKHFGVE